MSKSLTLLHINLTRYCRCQRAARSGTSYPPWQHCLVVLHEDKLKGSLKSWFNCFHWFGPTGCQGCVVRSEVTLGTVSNIDRSNKRQHRDSIHLLGRYDVGPKWASPPWETNSRHCDVIQSAKPSTGLARVCRPHNVCSFPKALRDTNCHQMTCTSQSTLCDVFGQCNVERSTIYAASCSEILQTCEGAPVTEATLPGLVQSAERYVCCVLYSPDCATRSVMLLGSVGSVLQWWRPTRYAAVLHCSATLQCDADWLL